MKTALILADAERCGLAATLRALGYEPLADAESFDLVVLDAARLGAEPALLSDLRRTDASLPIVLLVGDGNGDIELVGPAIGYDRLGFAAVDANTTDLMLALTAAAGAGPEQAREGDGGYALRLAALGEEIARIARAIEPAAVPAEAPPVPEAPLAFDPALVRGVIRSRRRRDALFADGLFADPVWDMLLDLTVARGEGVRVSVSSLTIAAAVPTTTALRHLKAMVDAGLVIRRPDLEDGRRTWIDLSDDAFARMRAWVADLPKSM